MRPETNKRLILAAAFLLPAAVMAAVFAACGIAPFGTRTIGVMDMAHQYLPFLYSLRDILTGRASLLYLPSMCLGGNMLGVAAYYLTSPLNLICCLFPRESMYTAISLTYFLRVGLCGLTMCIYTGRRHGYGWRCLVPAAAYALTAYMVGYCFNYLWQDCVILLPVVALGIARLCEERRPWLYVISLAAALLLNFYIGYILCLFSVLFFLYELFSVPRQERDRPWRTLLTFVLSSLAAGALAAVLLLPVVFALSGGKAEFSLSVLTFTPGFAPVALLSKLYVGAFNYEEIMPSGLPQIFCGTVTTALTVLYFANRNIPVRRRLLTGGLMLVLALSFWITALDLIWHALNTPTWYNYRYSFLLSFLMAAAAERELAEVGEGTRSWHLILPVALCAAASALVFFGQSYAYVTWRSAIEAILVSAVVSLLLWLLLRAKSGKRLAAVAAAALVLLHVGDLAANADMSLTALIIPASNSAAYAEYVTAKGEAFDRIDTGGQLIRVESPTQFNQDRCEPMLFGYDGISYYGSTVSQESLAFLERLGVDRYDEVWAAYGPGVTAAADSLLGIRYLVSQNMDKDYLPVDETDSYTIWENTLALPVGWTANASFADAAAEDCFAYLNALYAAAAPEVRGEVFTHADVLAAEADNLNEDGQNYTLVDEMAEAQIVYTLRIQADGALYGMIKMPGYPGVIISVDGSVVANYGTPQTNGSVYLGDFSEGDEITVAVDVFSDLTVEYAAFATENTEVLAGYCGALNDGGCRLQKLSPSHFKGSFTTGAGDSLLVLTIPFDNSWTILLDGQRAEPVRVQECLTALPVTEGTHTVEMRYRPAGLMPGAVISVTAAAACIAVYVLQQRKKKTKNSQ